VIYTATFTVVSANPAAGEFGAAAAGSIPAVGAWVTRVKKGIGVVATQAWVSPRLVDDLWRLLESGAGASEALEEALETDEGRERRQIAVLDAEGEIAACTGRHVDGYASHVEGDGFVVMGNQIAGPEVLREMAGAFVRAKGDLADGMLAALEAGDRAGGDLRGRRSAAIQVVNRTLSPFVDLRVDDDPRPVERLRDALEAYRAEILGALDRR